MQNGVGFVMGPTRLALLLVLLGLGAACSPGGSTTWATRSPVSSPSASATSSSVPPPSTSTGAPAPKPVVGAYGALDTPITGRAQYTVALIGIDGKVAASAQTTSPAVVTCPGAGAPLPLPVSTSNSRLHFMDGQCTVYYLSPSADTGSAPEAPAV